jgi:diaminohydroxyphosphoribosylaminopyrimidine deaminase/5-amino-6-(5-phosphoribosylamino)uracil reductase
MRLALAIAERGRGGTSPNPMVGALVVSPEGVVVGTGHHERAGGPHAEVNALRAAGAAAAGATVYCSLEPCSHVGRTGPCAHALAAAGVRRVVAAMVDPNPLVAGAGLAFLAARGVETRVGVLEREAARLNAAFLTAITARRPFVTLKVAISLDGMVAAAPGVRTAISGAASQRHAQRVRAEVDAIAIGSGTVLADDPELTARDVYRARPLTRVVFDRRLRTPAHAAMLRTLDAGPVLVLSTEQACAGAPERVRALEAAGATVAQLPADDPGCALELLASRGITSLVVEGGPRLHAAFWRARLVDRVRQYVAPKPLGAGGMSWAMPADFAIGALHDLQAMPLGDDVLIEGDVHRIG